MVASLRADERRTTFLISLDGRRGGEKTVAEVVKPDKGHVVRADVSSFETRHFSASSFWKFVEFNVRRYVRIWKFVGNRDAHRFLRDFLRNVRNQRNFTSIKFLDGLFGVSREIQNTTNWTLNALCVGYLYFEFIHFLVCTYTHVHAQFWYWCYYCEWGIFRKNPFRFTIISLHAGQCVHRSL